MAWGHRIETCGSLLNQGAFDSYKIIYSSRFRTRKPLEILPLTNGGEGRLDSPRMRFDLALIWPKFVTTTARSELSVLESVQAVAESAPYTRDQN